MTAQARNNSRVDWIDLLMGSIGFVAAVVVMTALDESFHIKLTGQFLTGVVLIIVCAGPMVRRALGRGPLACETKTGPMWSLLSILAIFAMLGAVLAGIFAAVEIHRSLDRGHAGWSSALDGIGIAVALVAFAAFVDKVRSKPLSS